MQSEFNTERLSLSSLLPAHDQFILELVNTPGWLRFIGDRNINDTADAHAYIDRINGNSIFKYWVATLRSESKPIGIITFIKRDYLDFPDIGFAFLPQYARSGYGFEATSVILSYLLVEKISPKILATTIPENLASIALLTKLRFIFQHEIKVDGHILLVYQNCQ
jgi:RimJ/RimL family protein N-acetyltransferase